MTYKELLDSVSFEEIVPFIEKYHGDKVASPCIRFTMICCVILPQTQRMPIIRQPL